MKQSFLSNIIGRDTYDTFKGYAGIVIAIGTLILAVVYSLSFFFHWGFISSILDSVTGTSLIFIFYIAELVLALDIEVEVDEPERNFWYEPEIKTKPTSYNYTIVWGLVLIALGISAIYFSNKYRKHYAFECSTFLVDHQEGVFHLDWDNECEVAAESVDLEKMKGYQIDKSYTLCEWCEEWVEDAEDEYESTIYYRR